MSALGDFFRKAQDAISNLRGGNNYFLGKNGDIVYSKNNVCVHEVSAGSGEESDGAKGESIVHTPGYLTIHCQDDDECGVTLILQWLPNATLHKNPASIRSVSPRGHSSVSSRSFHSSSTSSSSTTRRQRSDEDEEDSTRSPDTTSEIDNASLATTITSPEISVEMNGDVITVTSVDPPPRPKSFKPDQPASLLAPAGSAQPRAIPQNGDGLGVPSINVIPNTPVDPHIHSDDEEGETEPQDIDKVDTRSTSSLSTSGADDSDKDEGIEHDSSSCDGSEGEQEEDPQVPTHMFDRYRQECSTLLRSTPERFAAECGLALDDALEDAQTSSVAVARGRAVFSNKTGAASLFSVNLGKMRSMRVFFSDAERTCGQIVIASMDSRYKILHFHHGGLDKLAQLFEHWSSIKAKSVKEGSPSPVTDRHLVIWQPAVSKGELDPEDGLYDAITNDFWKSYKNKDGVVDDNVTIRKAIYFASMDPSLRKEIWPFLLRVYPWESTLEQREATRNDLFLEYQNLKRKRIKKSTTTMKSVWAEIENAIVKDVVRTDRKNPYFAEDDNPNLMTMKNILLNYAAACPEVNYIQGMSDLLAPLLATIRDESDTYWNFCGLMQTTLFASAPKIHENLMDMNLDYLRELLKLLQPEFFAHLVALKGDALQLMFVHRWILLCFKREFPENDALHIWEACWARYRTDYFHLFVCVAIVSVYGRDVISQKLPHDEILLHFAALSMHMDAKVVLKKARGLLYALCRLERLPCTLGGLVETDSSDQWNSHRGMQYECTQMHGDESCPFAS